MGNNKPVSLSVRVIAALIDSLLMSVIWYYSIEVWGHTQSSGSPTSVTAGGDKVLTGWAAVLLLLLTAAFWILPEWIAGATIGKFVCGLRVRSRDGRPIGLIQSVKRNSLRIVDFFPFYIPGFICAALTPNRQRLGDLWADTIVVHPKGSGGTTKTDMDRSP